MHALAVSQQDKAIDWAFVDINLPDMKGLDLAAAFKQSDSVKNFVVLSSEIDAKTIQDSLLMGVNGVLAKR